MSALFRQAITGLAVPVTVIAGVGFSTRHGRSARVFFVGLALTGVALAAMWGYSWFFEVRHPNQAADFWRRQETKMRPRLFAGFSFGLIAGAGTMVLSFTNGQPFIAAALLAPTFVCFSGVVLMWGKVPEPLRAALANASGATRPF